MNNCNHEEEEILFTKPARTADDQLRKLKLCGLIVSPEDEIEIKLKIRAIGYFRLSGYFGPLQESKDKFKPNVSFKDILRLYDFDSKLKVLLFSLLEKFEIALRAKLTDTYSLAYDAFWYKNKDLFSNETEKIRVLKCELDGDQRIVEQYRLIECSRYDILINETLKSIERVKDTEYMKAFYRKYSENSSVPSWMVMESASFGRLSKFYALLNASELKTSIAQHFGAINKDYFISWLHGLVVLRNSCAHHGRLWNRNMGKDIKMPTLLRKRFITDREDMNIRKFYGISSVLLHIFRKNDQDSFKKFKLDFLELVKIYDIDLHAMGFPLDWDEDELWKT